MFVKSVGFFGPEDLNSVGQMFLVPSGVTFFMLYWHVYTM